jgi:WD40 repeat protein
MISHRVGIGGLVLLTLGAVAPLAQEAPRGELSLSTGPVKRFGTNQLRHGSRIQCLLYAPQGAFPEAPEQSLLLAGGGNDPVRLWNTETGQRLRAIDFPWAQGLAWNAKDRSLAVAGVFRSLRIISPREPSQDIKHEGAPAALTAIAISPDGKPILVGCQDGQLLLYFPSNRKAVHVFGHKGEVKAVAAAPSGKLYASGGGDRAIVLWRLTPDGLEKAQTLTAPGMVRALAFTPDGQTLISAGDDRALRLWNVATGQIAHSLDGHKDTPAALALSSDGKTLVSTGYDESAIIWDLAARAKASTIPIRFGDADALAISPDGKQIAVAGGNNIIRLFETATGKERRFGAGAQSPLAKIAYFPSLDTLTALTANGEIHQWHAKSAKPVKDWATARAPLVQQDMFLLAAPDETVMVTATSARTALDLWRPADGKHVGAMPLPAGEALSATAFAPDGKTLALGFRSGLVHLIDWPSRDLRAKAKASGPVHALAFSPDAPVLATAAGGKVELWDVPTGHALRHFLAKDDVPENQQPVLADLAFSPDGNTLAMSGYDTVIRLVDWPTGKLLTTCEGHTSAVLSVAFAPDGRTFTSGSFDKTVRLWETFTGKTIETFSDHDGPVTSVVFAPNGRTVYSASADGRALAWDPSVLIFERSAAAKLDAKKLQSLWTTLAGESGNLGQAAIWRLVAAPKEGEAFLSSKVFLIDPKAIDQLFSDLDARDFPTREKATQELEKYGRWMEGRIEAILQDPPSLEVKRRLERMLSLLDTKGALPIKQERLRMLRVLQTLEQIGDPPAVKVLDDLARGAAEPALQREAELSLKRLQKRAG